jgi:hypothetical protein
MSPAPRQTRAERRQAELEARRTSKKELRQRETRQQAAATALVGSYPTWLPAAMAGLAAIIVLFFIGFGGLLDATLPIAGDQVTHNWWLIEFRDRLFGPGAILGWTNDLSAGYLFGFFYFPLPPIVFSVLSLALPDAMAIKLMVAGSLVLLPVAALRLARGLGFSTPAVAIAPLLALAAIFSSQPQFVGGTLYSTLTGEFSYAYSLAFSMLALAEILLLTKEKGSWWRAGLFLAAAVTSHILAALPAVLVAAVLLLRQWKRSTSTVISLLVLSLAGSLWWILPSFTMAHESLGDGHLRVTDLLAWLFPLRALPLVLLGLLGLVLAWRHRRPGRHVLTALVASGPAFLLLMPGSFMWNVRTMPWYYTGLALCLVYVIEPAFSKVVASRATMRLFPALVLLGSLVLALAIPENFALARSIGESQYGGKNLSGTKYVNEITEVLDSLEPGRAMVAVPDAWAGVLPARDWVTALPLYTDGKISSAISLYYEASRTTPAIEYTHSYVSDVAHTSLSWLKYRSPEDGFATGLRALRLLGIRYYIVGDQKMFDLASKESGLRLVGSVGTETKLPAHQWAIFEVENADLIEPVRTRIEVVPSLPSERAWASAAVNWMDTYDPALADKSIPLPLEFGPSYFDGTRLYDPTVVSNIEITDEKISFDVSRTGTPVLIKVSHSSRWEASGATGPFRAAPNFMLVVPTEPRVELTFKTPFTATIAPWLSLLLLLGLLSFRLKLLINAHKSRTTSSGSGQ